MKRSTRHRACCQVQGFTKNFETPPNACNMLCTLARATRQHKCHVNVKFSRIRMKINPSYIPYHHNQLHPPVPIPVRPSTRATDVPPANWPSTPQKLCPYIKGTVLDRPVCEITQEEKFLFASERAERVLAESCLVLGASRAMSE